MGITGITGLCKFCSGGGLSWSAVEHVEIKLNSERTFRDTSPLVNLLRSVFKLFKLGRLDDYDGDDYDEYDGDDEDDHDDHDGYQWDCNAMRKAKEALRCIHNSIQCPLQIIQTDFLHQINIQMARAENNANNGNNGNGFGGSSCGPWA